MCTCSLQVAEAARREEKLKKMFSGRAAAFREACYGLFGYRVDMDSAAAPPGAAGEPPATTFTLKPMHADDAKACARARETTLDLTQTLVVPCVGLQVPGLFHIPYLSTLTYGVFEVTREGPCTPARPGSPPIMHRLAVPSNF